MITQFEIYSLYNFYNCFLIDLWDHFSLAIEVQSAIKLHFFIIANFQTDLDARFKSKILQLIFWVFLRRDLPSSRLWQSMSFLTYATSAETLQSVRARKLFDPTCRGATIAGFLSYFCDWKSSVPTFTTIRHRATLARFSQPSWLIMTQISFKFVNFTCLISCRSIFFYLLESTRLN